MELPSPQSRRTTAGASLLKESLNETNAVLISPAVVPPPAGNLSRHLPPPVTLFPTDTESKVAQDGQPQPQPTYGSLPNNASPSGLQLQARFRKGVIQITKTSHACLIHIRSRIIQGSRSKPGRAWTLPPKVKYLMINLPLARTCSVKQVVKIDKEKAETSTEKNTDTTSEKRSRAAKSVVKKLRSLFRRATKRTDALAQKIREKVNVLDSVDRNVYFPPYTSAPDKLALTRSHSFDLVGKVAVFINADDSHQRNSVTQPILAESNILGGQISIANSDHHTHTPTCAGAPLRFLQQARAAWMACAGAYNRMHRVAESSDTAQKAGNECVPPLTAIRKPQSQNRIGATSTKKAKSGPAPIGYSQTKPPGPASSPTSP